MKSIIVLLSTYNGEKFLKPQLDSILNQHYNNLRIVVRDDGSKDSTLSILKEYSETYSNFSYYSGDNMRPAYSFLNLLCNAPVADYYAFCDQDDVWLPEKMGRAIKKLEESGANLYYSNYQMVDESLNYLSTNLKYNVDTIGKACVLTTATGCTMVFSKKLRDIVATYSPQYMWMHDSWLLKIALSTCLPVYFDKKAYILYRQHSMNVIGGIDSTYKERWADRFKRLLNKEKVKSKEIKELTTGFSHMMEKDIKDVVVPLVDYYNKNIFRRLVIAFNPAYRTGIFSKDIIFKIAILINRY